MNAPPRSDSIHDSSPAQPIHRDPPFGARVIAGGVQYRAWSPESTRVEVEIHSADGGARRVLPMTREEHGHYRALDHAGKAGNFYKFRLNGRESFPDPGSRAQRDSVHGASVVVDPGAYAWGDTGWVRPRFRDLVIYEAHVCLISARSALLRSS